MKLFSKKIWLYLKIFFPFTRVTIKNINDLIHDLKKTEFENTFLTEPLEKNINKKNKKKLK